MAMAYFRHAIAILVFLFCINESEALLNGHPIKENQYPFFVSIFTATANNESRICIGAIMSDQWVLTAASCLLGAKQDSLYASVGEHYFIRHFNEKRNPIEKVGKIIELGKFNPKTFENNAVLLKLEKKLNMTGAVQAAQISKASSLADGSNLSVVGWGTTFKDGKVRSVSKTCQKIQVQMKDKVECSKYYSRFKNDSFLPSKSEICAGDTLGLTSLCNFDDGAPLFYEKDGQAQIVGVASLREDDYCFWNGQFITYTDVRSLRQNITDIMNCE